MLCEEASHVAYVAILTGRLYHYFQFTDEKIENVEINKLG